MSEGVGCLLGGKGEDEIFEEDEVMLIGDDKMGDDEGNMVVDYVKGSGESGGYCTPDEKECKSMVNMDCVSVNPPEVGMIFDTWQEADMYYNAWVFSTWIDVVGRIPPMAILTDQNAAMRKAFKNVISQTRHRWCLWHITEKFGSKLGKCKGAGNVDSGGNEAHVFGWNEDNSKLADGNSTMYLHDLIIDFKIEETFRNVYTEAKFMEVQRECKSDIDKNEKPVNRWKMYRVLYNAKTEEVECECMLFEYNEILCRHCINALEVQQIPDVPKKYILDRWQKDVYRKHSRVKVSYHDLSKITEVLRYDKMMLAFEPISCLDSENDDALSMVIAGLQELEVNIKKIVKPTLPLSSVGEAKTKSTPQSVNKALVSTQFHIPSSVARSVIDGGLVEMNKRL
uniref:Protein FAR1-RELATED SEQUENCE n=1 Tax=Chenopodium quinoa TaxID=63459 RepID=A0A803MVK2_CHEQI